MRSREAATFAAVGFLALALGAGCTNEKIVYRSGTDFTTPPTSAANFIGYYDATNKQTVCGSCHVDYQTRWSATKHGSAWKDLQASGHATGACSSCHAVNNLGNAVTDTENGSVGEGDDELLVLAVAGNPVYTAADLPPRSGQAAVAATVNRAVPA